MATPEEVTCLSSLRLNSDGQVLQRVVLLNANERQRSRIFHPGPGRSPRSRRVRQRDHRLLRHDGLGKCPHLERPAYGGGHAEISRRHFVARLHRRADIPPGQHPPARMADRVRA